jgi:3-deoxy-7-phosphoheptulonate synthase
MIDFSHANSSKDYRKQADVAADVAAQLAGGETRIVGVMVESHLNPGRQDLLSGKKLEYGVSITDACIGWGRHGEAAGYARRCGAQAPRRAGGMR